MNLNVVLDWQLSLNHFAVEVAKYKNKFYGNGFFPTPTTRL